MQSSIWKIVAAIGIVGIGTLVVLEVQHRLPTAQQGGAAPTLSAEQLAEMGEKSVVPDAETELDRMLSGAEVSDPAFGTEEPPFSVSSEPEVSGAADSPATLVMAPVDTTVNRSQLFEGDSPFQSTDTESAASGTLASAPPLAASFGTAETAVEPTPAFSEETSQPEKASAGSGAAVRTASFTSGPDVPGAIGAIGASGQRTSASAAAPIPESPNFFGGDTGDAAGGNSSPDMGSSDLPAFSELNESALPENTSAAGASRQRTRSAGGAADDATPNLMFFGDDSRSETAETAEPAGVAVSPTELPASSPVPAASAARSTNAARSTAAGSTAASARPAVTAQSVPDEDLPDFSNPFTEDSAEGSGTTIPSLPSDSGPSSRTQPRTPVRESGDQPAEPTVDFFSDDGAVPVPQPVGGRPTSPNTPDASPFDVDPVQPPRDVPSRNQLERSGNGETRNSGSGNSGIGDPGRRSIDFPTLEELPVPETDLPNPASGRPSDNPFSFPDEAPRSGGDSRPANPRDNRDAFPDAFEADGPDLNAPDYDRPDLDRPDLDRPDLDRPDLDRPDLDRPEFDPRNQPGIPSREDSPTLPDFDGRGGRDSDPSMDAPGAEGMTETIRPHVSIRKSAPETASVGVPMDYTIVVMNEGQAPAYDVVIEDQLGRGINLVTTNPTSDSFDRSTGRMSWQIAELAAGEKREIAVRVNPVSEGTMDGVATVRFKTQVKATTVITAPRLTMELTGPEEVRVGDEINFRFLVRNEGSGEATNVILRSVLPAALRHAEGQDLEYEIASLKPSEEREILLTVLASEKTTTAVRAEVSTAGLATATAETSIHVVGEQLTVERLGPERRYVNRPAQFQNIVTNATNFEAVNAVVLEKVAEGMKFVSAPGGEYNPQTRVITWRLDRVAPGKQVLLDVELLPETAGDKDTIVEVVENAGFRAQVSRTIAVEDLHNVSADISRLDGPVAVGEKFTFTITIDNRGTATANEVQLTVQVPAQIRILAAGSKEQGITARLGKGNIVVYNPVVKVEPNQLKTFQLVLQGQESVRNGVVKAQLKYAEMQEPLVVSESVTVYSDSL